MLSFGLHLRNCNSSCGGLYVDSPTMTTTWHWLVRNYKNAPRIRWSIFSAQIQISASPVMYEILMLWALHDFEDEIKKPDKSSSGGLFSALMNVRSLIQNFINNVTKPIGSHKWCCGVQLNTPKLYFQKWPSKSFAGQEGTAERFDQLVQRVGVYSSAIAGIFSPRFLL